MQLLILAITSSSTQRHIGSPPGGVTAWQAVGCTSRDLGFNSVCLSSRIQTHLHRRAATCEKYGREVDRG